MKRFTGLEVLHKFMKAEKHLLYPDNMKEVSPLTRRKARMAGMPLLWSPRLQAWIVTKKEQFAIEYVEFMATSTYSYLLAGFLGTKSTQLPATYRFQLKKVISELGVLMEKTPEQVLEDLAGPTPDKWESESIQGLIELMDAVRHEPSAA